MKKTYMNSTILTNESGRSMVEMLGVLAVIGVLSVTGIAGYSSAMKKRRANEIVNATSMLYMLGIAQNDGAGDAQMVYSTHFGANAVPSGVSEITYNADKTITLSITDTDICNQVKNNLGDRIAGDCTSIPCSLTVTFGEKVSEPEFETPQSYYCDEGVLYRLVFTPGVEFGDPLAIGSCQCPSGSSGGRYKSDRAAIDAICVDGKSEYFCSSGYIIYAPTTTGVLPCSRCATTYHGNYYFSSEQAAFNALCAEGKKEYYCASGYLIDEDSNYIQECNCSGGEFSSDQEAIDALCEE